MQTVAAVNLEGRVNLSSRAQMISSFSGHPSSGLGLPDQRVVWIQNEQ